MWSIIWVLNWESLNPPRKFVDLSVTFGGVGSLKFSFWAHATALPVLMLSSWLLFGRESIVFNLLPTCKFADHFCVKRAWSHCRSNSGSEGPPDGRTDWFFLPEQKEQGLILETWNELNFWKKIHSEMRWKIQISTNQYWLIKQILKSKQVSNQPSDGQIPVWRVKNFKSKV